MFRTLAAMGLALIGTTLLAAEPSAAERGKKALLGRHFTGATYSSNGYRTAWRFWEDGTKKPPERYDEAFMAYYGLHTSPYPNDGFPMGLRPTAGLFGRKLLTTDCMLCHGGSIMGESHVGLGNASLDIETLFLDLAAAEGMPRRLPFTFSNVRGTSEAGAFSVYLLGMRDAELNLRAPRLDLGLHDDMCEDVPAWWLLKKKKTMYFTGGADAHSVRSLMQFMMSPINSGESIKREEETFRDIQAYLLSLQPPKYPFPIDQPLADKGSKVFAQNCEKCHGTYGEKWTYPNRIVPIDEIGTDAKRFQGISDSFGRYYAKSWFAKEEKGWFVDDFNVRPPVGYQAPPLDGIWATAPYFHNGSAPTVADVLNSKSRPKIFTRSYRTDKDAYDAAKVGWKVEVLDRAPDPRRPGHERRKVYDTTQPGRSNGGHTYGDDLTEEQRRAVIEYLKTL
ncbi:MAG: c-type cytochrome [Gemmataceae bacterium]|nr:c-type cytochrome [Gemmataceae bacterium]